MNMQYPPKKGIDAVNINCFSIEIISSPKIRMTKS